MAQLIQSLPDGPLDIIGDVHGEIEALHRLLQRLGCDVPNARVERPIVFVGDLIDRGPNSPAVLDLVSHLVAAGVAYCVLGNHEINLLRGKAKEGNGWARADTGDHHQHSESGDVRKILFQSQLCSPEAKRRYLDFLRTLPLVLQRDDLRVVHACWDADAIAALPKEGHVAELSDAYSDAINQELKSRGLLADAKRELEAFAYLKRRDVVPSRPLKAHPIVAQAQQSGHPIKVITSGPERIVADDAKFFTGGKWRYVERTPWWQTYDGNAAVVVGHYWRRRLPHANQGKPDSWQSAKPTDWCGPTGRVFCVDYSVGRRFLERAVKQVPPFDAGLGALRWPERILMFDDQTQITPTTRWGMGAI